MIKINKGPSPVNLTNNFSKKRLKRLKDLYKDNTIFYQTNNFDITDAYKSDSVKETLEAVQFNKCSYSEAKFLGGVYPQVEHFRPKKMVDDYPSGSSHFPGYYWLAYDWSNLFFSMPLINCSYKKNFFPLEAPHQRNRNHLDSFVEFPTLIDPSIEDPRDHIYFYNEDVIYKTERGRVSIKILGLRDPQFMEARLAHLKTLKILKKWVDNSWNDKELDTQILVAETTSMLSDYLLPDATFSSMARDFLKGWPPLALVLDSDGNLLSS